MPAKHILHVALTEPLVRYVREDVAAGHHQTASDVVRVELRALIERDTGTQWPVETAAAERVKHG